MAWIQHYLNNPAGWALGAFQIWMLIDAIRREEWMWVFFLLFGFGFSPFLYFFWVYRASPSPMAGFELPGVHDRRRIRELEAQIHHLDKAHHHFQLGDIYFQKGKLVKAEECYRASLERDPTDIDARAHMGQCLLRQGKADAARPILQQVLTEKRDHEYGYTMMAYAEMLSSLGDKTSAIATWKLVLENHSYARARVQLSELLLAQNETALAKAQAQEAINDDRHAPSYQRKRDRVWIRRAKRLVNS